jgi:hypothetical protein
MPQSEARAWWADVEHVRETIERRRAAERHLSLVRDASASPDPPGEQRAPARAARAQRPQEAARRSGSSAGARHRAGRPAAHRSADRAHRPAERRTVEITGRTVPAPALPEIGHPPALAFGARGAGRRPSLTPTERIAHRPDRIALWAVVLGFVLIVVAATSG